eukprot:COSAG01_NODE_215_length_21709_cov_141.101217_14_plen_82_part_00
MFDCSDHDELFEQALARLLGLSKEEMGGAGLGIMDREHLAQWLELPATTARAAVSRPFPSWNRPTSTEIDRCHACFLVKKC